MGAGVELLFDLDGTLTDSGPGITRCIQHALDALGQPVPSMDELRWCVGPPLRGSFARLVGTSEAAVLDRAVGLYRERFESVGMFENAVYPGVEAGLRRLRAAGHRLWVVTSKPHPYARKILDHFELSDAFVSVYGSELTGENSEKTDLIRLALATERFEGLPAMIGDRRQDIDGAHANGLRALGVLWGYGSRAELEAAGSDRLVTSMEDLCDWADQSPSTHFAIWK